MRTDHRPALAAFLAVTAVILSLPAAALAASAFVRTDVGSGASPGPVAVADFNGDGRLDLASITAGDRLTVLFARADGTFGDKADYDLGDGAAAFAAADMNGDGAADVVSANRDAGTVTVMRGGASGLADRFDYDVGADPADVALADFNGDTYSDLVTADSGRVAVTVLYGQPNATFLSLSNVYIGAQPLSVATGDFNGDDLPDFAVGSHDDSGVGDPIYVLPGRAEGGFGNKIGYTAGVSPVQLIAIDMNRDDRLDLVSLSRVDLAVTILYAQTDNTFGDRLDVPVDPGASSIAVADANADGKRDIILTNPSGDDFSVFFANSSGFVNRTDFGVGDGPEGIAAADVNGDGRADIVCANAGGASLSVMAGLVGGFGSSRAYGVGNSASAAAVGDVNGDTRLDAIVINSADNDFSILYGQSNGALGSRRDVGAPAGPTGAASADLNGDTFADMAIAGGSTVAVLFGQSSGVPTGRVDYPVGAGARSPIIADLNGDDVPDIAVADSAGTTVSILPGQAAGAFGAATTLDIAAAPRAVAAGDFDADGLADLAVLNDGNDLAVFYGQSGGTLGGRIDRDIEAPVIDVAAADVIGDSASDVIVAVDSTPARILIFPGAIGGSLADEAELGLFFSPSGLAVADADHDGRADIVAPGAGAVTVFFNSASGFNRVEYLHGTNASFAAAADLSTDGFADIIVGSAAAQVTVLTNDFEAVSIAPTTLPTAGATNAYSQSLFAAGGVPPYTWAVTAGALPDGLALSPSGTISGTPAVAGTFSFTVQVTDSSVPPTTAEAGLELQVNEDLAITTTSLPDARLGTPYSQTMAATGGVPPYQFIVLEGQLPLGLALNTSTGVISGTPNAPGNYGFRIRARDAQDPADMAVQLFEVGVFAPDADAPVVENVALVPTQIREGVDLSATLTATADDDDTGHSNIVEAEFFIGADPGNGNGTAMAAADGAFDSVTEAVTATVDTSDWTAPTPRRINVRARDETGRWTTPVATLDVEVVDGTAPGTVSDLRATASTSFAPINATESSSSQSSPGSTTANVLDRDQSTYWRTSGRTVPDDEFIVLDVESTTSVDAVGITPSIPGGQFPATFEIQTSTDGTDWTTAANARNLKANRLGFLWQLERTDARYVRIVGPGVLDRRDGRYYWQIGEIAIYRRLDKPAAILTWTAPADNGLDASSGPAAAYDIRFADSALSAANFDVSEAAEAEITPGAPGSPERVAAAADTAGGRTFFALRAADSDGNTSQVSNSVDAVIGLTGFTPDEPTDGFSPNAGTPPTFRFAGSGMAGMALAFSGDRGFPQTPAIDSTDGTLRKTARVPVRAGQAQATPSAAQWRTLKSVTSAQGALFWRLEGKDRTLGTVFGPTRVMAFDSGEITGLAVNGSHPVGADEAIWPDVDDPPTLTWDDATVGMERFFVDISTEQSTPPADRRRTIVLGGRGIEGESYTLTAAEWKRMRQLAAASGGTLYWRVRAQDADRALTLVSEAKALVIDGGTWTIAPLDLSASPATVAWTHETGTPLVYSVEFSSDAAFPANARTTMRVPARPTAGSEYTLTEADLRRLDALAARNSVATLNYRIRGEDGERAFITYSPSETTAAP